MQTIRMLQALKWAIYAEKEFVSVENAPEEELSSSSPYAWKR